MRTTIKTDRNQETIAAIHTEGKKGCGIMNRKRFGKKALALATAAALTIGGMAPAASADAASFTDWAAHYLHFEEDEDSVSMTGADAGYTAVDTGDMQQKEMGFDAVSVRADKVPADDDGTMPAGEDDRHSGDKDKAEATMAPEKETPVEEPTQTPAATATATTQPVREVETARPIPAVPTATATVTTPPVREVETARPIPPCTARPIPTSTTRPVSTPTVQPEDATTVKPVPVNTASPVPVGTTKPSGKGTVEKRVIEAEAGMESEEEDMDDDDIELSRPQIKAVKYFKAKKIKLSFKKIDIQADGYEVRYSKFSSMVMSKTISNEGDGSCTLKNLKKRQSYYAQIRVYKEVDGEKVYSEWSMKKKVYIRK